jgi:hypothetical protein
MDDREKVALVAQAIEHVISDNMRVSYDEIDYEAGVWEEAARQAIAAYMNAWRTTEPVSSEQLEADRRGYLTHADIQAACPYQAEFSECIYPCCGLQCKGRFVDRRKLMEPGSAGSDRQSTPAATDPEPRSP